MTDNICFLDTETTGLHPDKHQLWEVGLITPDDVEHVWQFPIVEIEADPFALNIGRYWERKCPTVMLDREWCLEFQYLTAGYHLAGAVVSFDEERIRRVLEKNGVLHRWHYHLIDVEALAAGSVKYSPPWKSEDLCKAIGVNPDDFEKHTAIGDARWAKAVYETVMSSG